MQLIIRRPCDILSWTWIHCYFYPWNWGLKRFDLHQDSIQKLVWQAWCFNATIHSASCALASIHTPEQQGAEEARFNCNLLNRRPAAASQPWASLPRTALVHRNARASWSVGVLIWSGLECESPRRQAHKYLPRHQAAFCLTSRGIFNSISEMLNNWYASRWQKGQSVQSRSKQARKMTEKKKLTRGDVSELTVSWSVFARFLKSLLSVFSRIWLYSTRASLMCPLKTSVDGLRCLLMVASEAASLTWWRRAKESQAFDGVLDGELWWKEVIFLPPSKGLEALF